MSTYYAPPVRTDELMHYGRQGMHWYQHIYGPVQSIAKYAKKAGSGVANGVSKAKAASEEREQNKIEKAIRSGNAKKINKLSSKMTDEQIRRADYRISENTKISQLAHPKSESDKRTEQFVKQQSKKSALDYINDAAKAANTIANTMDAVDKVSKKVSENSPEKKAQRDAIQKLINATDFEGYVKYKDVMTKNEKKDFVETMNNNNKVATYMLDNLSPSGSHDQGTHKHDKTNNYYDILKGDSDDPVATDRLNSFLASNYKNSAKSNKNIDASQVNNLDDAIEDAIKRHFNED